VILLAFLHSCGKYFLFWFFSFLRCHLLSYFEHTTPLFRRLNILKLNDLYHLRLGIFMYKHVHSMLPQVFDHLFSFSSSVHSYETRSSSKGDLFVLQNRTLYFRNSSFQRGVKYWNGLTDNLKECKTVVAFAKELKKKNNNYFLCRNWNSSYLFLFGPHLSFLSCLCKCLILVLSPVFVLSKGRVQKPSFTIFVHVVII
jgi:hypothetical protein